MVDVVVLFGRLLLLALLYLFLFAAVRAGIGLVRTGAPGRGEKPLLLVITAGPRELEGVKVVLDHTIRMGRDPALELVVADDFMSARHAQIVPEAGGPVLQDLGSTNGTLLNGSRVLSPTVLHAGDQIVVGALHLKVVAR